MNTKSSIDASPARQPVWDPLVRIFHWSLALFFVVAYLSEDDGETLHIYAGYTILALVVFRVVWGLIGTDYARFTNFVVGPRAVTGYLKQMGTGTAPRHIGHNPAAAAMIVSLLVFLTLTAFFGMILLAGEGGGPLAGTWFATLPEDPVEEVHEFFANGTLFLVALHILGVLTSSLMHRENLVLSMIHGRKRTDRTIPASSQQDISESHHETA